MSDTNDAIFLLSVHADKVRDAERNSWDAFRDICTDVKTAGSFVMSEISADITNACMDLEAMFYPVSRHPDFVVIPTSGTYGNHADGRTDHYN